MSKVYHRCFHAPHADALMSPLVFICGTELCWSTTGVWILLDLLGKLCCSLYIPPCSVYTWLCVLHLDYEYLSSDGSRLSWDSPVINPLPVLFNPLKPELISFCYLLALLGARHFLHVSRIRVKLLTFRRLMSYIYGAPILDVSRSHTTT